jgi:hypothetical protein
MDHMKIGCEYQRWRELAHYHDRWRVLATVVLTFRASYNLSCCIILLLLLKPPFYFPSVYKVGILELCSVQLGRIIGMQTEKNEHRALTCYRYFKNAEGMQLAALACLRSRESGASLKGFLERVVCALWLQDLTE